jgi:hypothetical protein
MPNAEKRYQPCTLGLGTPHQIIYLSFPPYLAGAPMHLRVWHTLYPVVVALLVPLSSAIVSLSIQCLTCFYFRVYTFSYLCSWFLYFLMFLQINMKARMMAPRSDREATNRTTIVARYPCTGLWVFKKAHLIKLQTKHIQLRSADKFPAKKEWW